MEWIYKQDYKLGFLQENIELLFYSVVCFFVPFLMGHPQLLVGIIVNSALVLAALNMKSYKLLPVILIPSLAVLSRGLIFGPYTIYLVIMIPFIWIGNSILVYGMKYLTLKKKVNKFVSLGASALVKVGFLFSVAFVLYSFGVVPAPILAAMGLMQLYTALIGGGLALGVQEVKKRLA